MSEINDAVKVGKFTLVNPDKIYRALHGSPDSKGIFVGGVMKPDGSYDDNALLVEYDRIGGLIRKGDDKVRTGSFYDFTAKKPREEANVELEFRIGGELVHVKEKAVTAKEEAVKKAARKIAKKATKKSK